MKKLTSVLIAAILFVLSYLMILPRRPTGIENWLFSFGYLFTFSTYCVVVTTIYLHLSDKDTRAPWLIILFAFSSLVICMYLALFVGRFDLLPLKKDESIWSEDYPKCFYFTGVTFTTLGYGDMVPVSTLGRMFAVFTAMFGLTHSVTFVSLVIAALSRPKLLPAPTSKVPGI